MIDVVVHVTLLVGGAATEAFGWVVTAATLGLSAAQVLSGFSVDLAGPPGAFLTGGLAGGVVAAVLWRRRDTLAPAPTEPYAAAC
ncbi:MAG: hypothetical protein L0H64_19310 [Pseudonocardia sp.]|nr:hypothetical protein [Pseudonocardia sp.]